MPLERLGLKVILVSKVKKVPQVRLEIRAQLVFLVSRVKKVTQVLLETKEFKARKVQLV